MRATARGSIPGSFGYARGRATALPDRWAVGDGAGVFQPRDLRLRIAEETAQDLLVVLSQQRSIGLHHHRHGAKANRFAGVAVPPNQRMIEFDQEATFEKVGVRRQAVGA